MPIILEEIYQLKNNNLNFVKYIKNKSILILGANSFIMSYLIILLATYSSGKTQIYLCTNNKTKCLNKLKALKIHNYKSIKFLKYEDLTIFNRKIDLLIHASSPASPKFYNIYADDLYKTNIIYLSYLRELVKKYKSKIVYISSGEVYGNFNSQKILKTNNLCFSYPFSSRALYADSKRLSEGILYSWFNNFKIESSVIRLFHTYGPYIDINDGRIFSYIIKSLLNKKEIHFDDPYSKRCYCYISDFTDALIKIILNTSGFKIFNCGNTIEEYDAFGLSKSLTKEFKEIKPNFTFNKKIKNGNQRIIRARPNISQLRSIGWKPKVNIAIGFRNTYNFFLGL